MSARHIFSPAKINLYLHITGRRDDGYHLLDSLAVFADSGDDLSIEDADAFGFTVNGPFASEFNPSDLKSDRDSSNLMVRAVYALSDALEVKPNIHITLTKNLPLASGLGGGSSNAASVIWGLLDHWGITNHPDGLNDILLSLGADVPVCFHCAPARMQGLGEILHPAPIMDEIPVLLINPRIICNTPDIFSNFGTEFRHEPDILPEALDDFDDLILFLKNRHNDLYDTAAKLYPDIAQIIQELEASKNCALARMSGSGATCFGLFENFDDARHAARQILKEHPEWWIQYGYINRPKRY